MSLNKKIVVIGAGISGLTSAYLLNNEGYEVTILEKSDKVGGSIETTMENGFIFDRGSGSVLETTSILSKLVEELNLNDQLMYANKRGNKKYILRNDQLHAMPLHPITIFKSNLFSRKAKLRLLKEPFIGKSTDGYYQSVTEFITRRLGTEFMDYAINPFVAGVYAGNPEDLSIKSAFPKLYELEEEYGSIIIGTIKSIRKRRKQKKNSGQSNKMLSFKDGMMVLPTAIAKHLGDRVNLSSRVTGVKKTNDGKYGVIYKKGDREFTLLTDVVLSTVPAYSATELFEHFDEGLKKHLNSIYYPPLLVLYLTYKKEDVGQPLDGFGFMVPSKEDKTFLGAIWNSVIFPIQAEENIASFTLFIGGSRNPGFIYDDEETLINKTKKEFEELMKIKGKPVYRSKRIWPKAIPQYTIGYVEHENYFDHFENYNKGIILSGGYRGGFSVGDCIKNAEVVNNKIKKLFKLHISLES